MNTTANDRISENLKKGIRKVAEKISQIREAYNGNELGSNKKSENGKKIK